MLFTRTNEAKKNSTVFERVEDFQCHCIKKKKEKEELQIQDVGFKNTGNLCLKESHSIGKDA